MITERADRVARNLTTVAACALRMLRTEGLTPGDAHALLLKAVDEAMNVLGPELDRRFDAWAEDLK